MLSCLVSSSSKLMTLINSVHKDKNAIHTDIVFKKADPQRGPKKVALCLNHHINATVQDEIKRISSKSSQSFQRNYNAVCCFANKHTKDVKIITCHRQTTLHS